ncbi:MAG: magnesium transporter [Verrucomicrobiales bacterium]|jgi:magnesium transporter
MTSVAQPDPIDTDNDKPWERVRTLLDSGNEGELAQLLETLSGEDVRLALSRLSNEDQAKLVSLLSHDAAADLLENLPEEQAADILEDVSAEQAAFIIEAMPEDIGVDVLQEMEPEDSAALLAGMVDPAGAERFRTLASYEWDSAGGLMSDAFASFSETATVGEVLTELNESADHYSDMDVQYVYTVTKDGLLAGVLKLRDLVLTSPSRQVSSVMIRNPASVAVDEPLESLAKTFDDHSYLGLPVVDDEGKLAGVVSRNAVQEAGSDHLAEEFLASRGIVGGEELRSMPLATRCRRRLAWLAPNIVLNLFSVTIIGMFESTLATAIVLAKFLPMVSDMSGCSGNQAVAVSIRELTLGIIRPADFWRIVSKEGLLGVINGLVLGTLVGIIASFWGILSGGSFNPWLGVVVGSALAINTLLSVVLGGLIPLLLKRFKADPALASSPILTTCTDMCGFFLVLSMAGTIIERLT